MTDLKVVKLLPVAQLFSLMSNNEEFNSTSLKAYNEFKERYENVLWNICKAVCRKNNFHKIRDLDKDVYRISMQEIYLNSSSFEESNLNASNVSQEELIIGWFGRIAETVKENIVSDHRKFNKLILVVPDYHEHLKDLKNYQFDKDEFNAKENKKDLEEELFNRRKKIFEKEWMKFKPREREILLEYFSITGGRKYLSEDRIAYLCAKWLISLDNLLQIKYRAFKKLERLCNDEEKKTENKSHPLNTRGEGI